ncbi:MAG: hypothetical protein CSA23_03830 [Deltaproteobacteria bacterium]|nr:MAG: hypothetical protein CSA23_03830 [Deltaproteobacteria bacterium]
MDSRLYVALVHYPVIDKNGETIASAVTNLDLHDIARACRTFGVHGFYVITPLEDQQVLVNRILDHWTSGVGSRYNPNRGQALERIQVTADAGGMIADITRRHGCRPRVVATSARQGNDRLSCDRLRRMMAQSPPLVLAFGTAWGLADEFMAAADHVLEPLVGKGTYNHLSVRSAVAIILDRLVSVP